MIEARNAEPLMAVEAKPGELTMGEVVREASIDRNTGLKALRAMPADGEVRSAPREDRRGHVLWPAD